MRVLPFACLTFLLAASNFPLITGSEEDATLANPSQSLDVAQDPEPTVEGGEAEGTVTTPEEIQPVSPEETTGEVAPEEVTKGTLTETTTEEQKEFAIFGILSQGSAAEPTTEIPDLEPVEPTNSTEVGSSRRLSDQIKAVIRNYREFGSVTVPGISLPEPLPVPDIKKTFAGNPMTFTTVNVYGLSNFTIDHVNTDLDKMQIFVALNIKRLIILGNYSVKSWFSKAAGPFNVTLLDVEATGAAELKKDEGGHLQASETEMDMAFKDAKVDFKNLGMMGSILQGVLASAAPILFDAIKPSILEEVNTKIRTDVNAKIRTIGEKIALSQTERPLDKAVLEGRRYIKENGYDPYHIKDYVIKDGVFKVNISHFWLTGLSRFYRVGDVSLSMDAGTLQIGVHLATQKLHGKCKWKVNITDKLSKEGNTNITVEHIQVRAIVNQSLDVSQRPVLHDLDIHVGKPKVWMQRNENFDFILEFAINSLPDLLRHIMVDALEGPLKLKTQQILNDIDVEDLVENKLPELDNIGL